MLKYPVKLVRAFHKKFDYPISEIPKKLTDERIRARGGHLLEEIIEFNNSKNIIDQIDATIDIIYLAIGNLVEIGIDGDKIFEIVHNANMNKKKSGKDRPNKQKDWKSPEIKILNYLESLENFNLENCK